MKHGETCNSIQDVNLYIEEVKECLKIGNKTAAFDRLTDLDNVWLRDQPTYMTRCEWTMKKFIIQQLLKRL